MNTLQVIEITAALIGFAATVLLYAFPRFGPTTWMLGLFLISASFSCAVLGIGSALGWLIEDYALLSFAGIVLCSAIGCLVSNTLQREEYLKILRKKRWFFSGIVAGCPLFVASLYVFRPLIADVAGGHDLIALGPAGYVAAVYTVLVA